MKRVLFLAVLLMLCGQFNYAQLDTSVTKVGSYEGYSTEVQTNDNLIRAKLFYLLGGNVQLKSGSDDASKNGTSTAHIDTFQIGFITRHITVIFVEAAN